VPSAMLVNPGVLFMDVGSTKRDVVDAARRVCSKSVPALHSCLPTPLLGAKSRASTMPTPRLYQGRKVILTPLQQTDPVLVQKATDVWAAVGCQVLKMTPETSRCSICCREPPASSAGLCLHERHGRTTRWGKSSCRWPALAFRDFSRIAASDPTIWRDILLSNREEILKQSASLPRSAGAVMERQMRDWNGPTLESLIDTASTSRSQWATESQITFSSPLRPVPHDAEHMSAFSPPLRMYTTAFLDLPPLLSAGGTVRLPGSKSISNRVLLLAGFERRHDRGPRPAGLGRHPCDARSLAHAGAAICSKTATRCTSPVWVAGWL
jgi:prephenate dehydrogenase